MTLQDQYANGARTVGKAWTDAAIEAIKTPVLQERMKGLGATVARPEQQSPEWLGSFVKSEIEKWAAPIKASGVSAD